jgi:hypothetical protein
MFERQQAISAANRPQFRSTSPAFAIAATLVAARDGSVRPIAQQNAALDAPGVASTRLTKKEALV